MMMTKILTLTKQINTEDDSDDGDTGTTQDPGGGSGSDSSDDDDEDFKGGGGTEGGEDGVSDTETDDNSVAALMAEPDGNEIAVGDNAERNRDEEASNGDSLSKYAKDSDFELLDLEKIDHMFDDMLNDDILKDDPVLHPKHKAEKSEPAASKAEGENQKHAESADSKIEPGEKRTGGKAV